MSEPIPEEILDRQWDHLLHAAHAPDPDPFLEERLRLAVTERAAAPPPRTAGRTTSRLAAAAVLLAAIGVVCAIVWQDPGAWRTAQDKALDSAIADLRTPTDRTRGARALRRAGAAAVPALIQALGDADTAFVTAARDLLVACGEPAVARLRKLIEGEDPNLRNRAIEAVARMGPEAVPALDSLLPVLDRAGCPRETVVALGQLVGFAPENWERVCAALCRAVCVQGGSLSSPQPHVEIARATQRGELVSRDRDALHQLLASEDPFRRELAAELLRTRGDETSWEPLARAIAARHPQKSNGTLADGGVRFGTKVAAKHDPAIRLAAARALVGLAPRKEVAAPAFVVLLGQGTVLEQFEAADAIGKLGVATPAAVEALRSGLDTRDRLLAGTLVTSLGMLGPAAAEAIPQLEAMEARPDKELRARARAALRQIRR